MSSALMHLGIQSLSLYQMPSYKALSGAIVLLITILSVMWRVFPTALL